MTQWEEVLSTVCYESAQEEIKNLKRQNEILVEIIKDLLKRGDE